LHHDPAIGLGGAVYDLSTIRVVTAKAARHTWSEGKYAMTRDDILAIVKSIYSGPTQNEIVTPLREKLREALPHSAINDLIFWNPVELTPEQVVDEAIRRETEYAREAGLK
jgi:hypothetical protein